MSTLKLIHSWMRQENQIVIRITDIKGETRLCKDIIFLLGMLGIQTSSAAVLQYNQKKSDAE